MLKGKICELREKLNTSIAKGKSYEEIYKLSVELDELIYKYYTKEKDSKLKKNKKEKNIN